MNNFLKMTIINMFRYKFKNIIYTIVISLTIMLLGISFSFAHTTNKVIDDNLNSLNSEVVYRIFRLDYEYSDTHLDLNKYIEIIKQYPSIENVHVLSLNKKTVTMDILVDDYRNVNKIIQIFSVKDNYTVIRYENSIINTDMIKTIKIIGVFSLLIIIILNFISITINIKSSIDDRQTEIALFKAMGYNHKHLFTLIYIESSVLTLISYFVAIFLIVKSLNKFVNPFIVRTFSNTLLSIQLYIDLNALLGILFILITITLLASLCSIKQIKKISPSELLKS
ncbi:FtsX-like permease family protein [Abyssisolibacter fermentans]|uniref:FtsX-like permease family protein n=1 Tax=Abyssisolibacter fermentans TaxID=1766203 RepID=UPI0008346B55|nr:ABC transporter permease [Abyssisolibacter fermentans]